MTTHRVLVVDDQSDVRGMLASGLKTLEPEIEVLELPSAEEALLVATRLSVDLLVSDVRLPGMSGLELMAVIRTRNPDVKIILITGVSDMRIRRQVAAAGADVFFYKPIEIADFLDAVERCLGLVETSFPMPSVADEPLASTDGPLADDAAMLPEAPPPTLTESLTGLRQELDALSTILVDDSGQILAQAGEFAEVEAESPLILALLTTMSASLKVSQTLGVGNPDNLFHFKGESYNLCLVNVGAGYALLVVTNDSTGAEAMGKIAQAAQAAVQDIQHSLTGMGVKELDQSVPPPPMEIEEVAVDEEEVVAAEAILGESEANIKDADADAFWDTLAEESASVVDNVDGLSYEEAHKLGLVPE